MTVIGWGGRLNLYKWRGIHPRKTSKPTKTKAASIIYVYISTSKNLFLATHDGVYTPKKTNMEPQKSPKNVPSRKIIWNKKIFFDFGFQKWMFLTGQTHQMYFQQPEATLDSTLTWGFPNSNWTTFGLQSFLAKSATQKSAPFWGWDTHLKFKMTSPLKSYLKTQ